MTSGYFASSLVGYERFMERERNFIGVFQSLAIFDDKIKSRQGLYFNALVFLLSITLIQ